MAIDSRSGHTACNTTTGKHINLGSAIASTDENEVASFLGMSSLHHDYTTSERFSHKLSQIPVFQDGVPTLFFDGSLRLVDFGDINVRRCPTHSEETGGSGSNGSRTTEGSGGARPKSSCSSNLRSFVGRRRGQGDGDDEDDEERPANYGKKGLNCDKKQNGTKRLKLKRDGSREPSQGRGSHSRRGHRSPMGTDEIDASMSEQASLLDQVQTAQKGLKDRVVYSSQNGMVVAFTQRLFGLWSIGASVTAGFSEGVIFDRNLVISGDGQYRFGEEFIHYAELGRGDFGITRACQDSKTGAKMATKEIPRDRFLPFEVLQLSKLRSPFIAQFLGATAEGGSLYLHMELVDNAYQLEHIASDASFLLTSQDLIVKILHQLLGALECLSQCAVIHRDLTCRNVLLTTGERIKVIDFNLAVPSPYEQNTMPVGDIHYLAPEVLDGIRYLTCAIDLWSAGIIIISLLRGLPQRDDCEKMAITGFHPMNCNHLGHCHPQLFDILQQMLNPDWTDRPKPGDLITHPVFHEALRDDLEEYPARPDDGVDSPDWSLLDHRDSDDNGGHGDNDDGSGACGNDYDDEDLPFDRDRDKSRVAAGEGHTSLLQASELSEHKLEALQHQPLSLPVGSESAGSLSSSSIHDIRQVQRNCQGARRKERKLRSNRVNIAASFKVPQGGGECCAFSDGTDVDSKGGVIISGHRPCSDALVVQELPHSRQDQGAEHSTPDMLQGAVEGTLGHAQGQNQKEPENVDSLTEVLRKVEMIEITKTREWTGNREGLERQRNHREPSGGTWDQVPLQMGDQVSSQAVTSREMQNDLCDGPYQYPENWLYGEESQRAIEEPEEQSVGSRHSPLVSNGGSSARGASLEEASLERDIIIEQLSLDNNPEYQEEFILQLGNGGAPSV